MLETRPLTLLWQLQLSSQDLLEEYAAYREAAGYACADRVPLWGARGFLQRYPDLESWRTAPLEEQLALPRSFKTFAKFLFLKHYLRPTMGYLLTARPQLAQAGKHCVYPHIYNQLHHLGQLLGYSDGVLGPTLHFLFYVMAYAGKSATDLTPSDLQVFDQDMRAYRPPPGHAFSLRTRSQHLYRVRVLLYQAGILAQPPLRHRPKPARAREELWAEIPGSLRRVAWRYLDQLSVVRAPDTVKNNEGYLRRFFAWLANTHPEITTIRAINRSHIEAFKRWLHETPCATGEPYHRHTIRDTLSHLRRFFQAMQEWGWPEAPQRHLVFAADLPVPDEALPRFLDDGQAAALLEAARASEDLFTRVCVEVLLRTGLRKGEFVRLQVDSIVQIGDGFWLRVPLGKLHNDRYVPLHPEVKFLLDEWIAQRGDGLRTRDLFVIHGRRVGVGRVDAAVKRAARAAGIQECVSAHRLRHTLGTQAINHGMSLEAIAALLGHRSLRMTLLYARIADQKVREQYFSVCQELDAAYAEAALEQQPGQSWKRREEKA